MADKPLTQEQKQALQSVGALGAFTVAAPVGAILPFQNLLSDQNKLKIKRQEAIRMFPQADPNMFDIARTGNQALPVIPLAQNIASSRVFNKDVNRGDLTKGSPLYPNNLYRGQQEFPIYLSAQPGAPSPELGSYAAAIGNKPIFSEGDIQAITVTPAPNPSRFAKDYAEILADKLGKTINEREAFLNTGLDSELPSYGSPVLLTDPFGTKAVEENLKTLRKLNKKVNVLSNKIPGTAGYIWGNISKPQYSYAEGNWGLRQKETGANPSIYLSRINADPSKEADYLFTRNILPMGEGVPDVEPRVKLTQYPDLGPSTGPSWGIASNKDISFRKDLIGARGELTVGDLQALLAEKNLPFAYQSYKKIPGVPMPVTGSKNWRDVEVKDELRAIQNPGEILKENLQRLAKAEGISTAQAAERFARLVPNVGEPVVPSTAAVTGRLGEFPNQGQMGNPFGPFAAKTDLRQIGILPPSDKTSYSPFDKLNISRDQLRPQAANKLLNRTVENLIEQSKPVRGLGFGGLAAGGITTAMDPAVIDALSRGDYQQAGTTAAFNTAIGSAVGGATAKGLQALQAAGYARPAAAIGSVLPAAGGVLAGLGVVETGKALNRAYKAQTGKDFVTRNQPASPYSTYAGPTPTIKPRMGTAILGGKPVQVPYGSVAGERKVGRPWWDKAGTQFQNLLNSFSPMLGR